jgi:ElaB/YqjD/DUF883 family membrane-anchored ribosome-binding protein
MNGKQLDDFADMMSDLMTLQQETNAYLSGKSVSGTEKNEFINKIKELLKKAQQLAAEIKPEEFTISAEISLPPKISISFTW